MANYKLNSEIKRHLVSVSISASIVDYIDIIADKREISRAEAGRRFLPISKEEYNRYDKPIVDGAELEYKRVISMNLTEAQYKLLVSSMKVHRNDISINEYFNRVFSNKMNYIIHQSIENTDHKKSYQILKLKISDKMKKSIVCCQEYMNKQYDTTYSKSRFVVHLINGVINSKFKVTDKSENTKSSRLTLYLYPNDIIAFRERYGVNPTQSNVRHLIENSIHIVE